jgi:6-pyruvoyltetrahydropterin/6-carboxytetrahydropterin synthase
MYNARIEAWFAAAHHLSDFHGKCERQHGHNYKVRVWARGNTLDAGGMLVDFGVLKSALGEVLAVLDHSDLNEIPEFGDNPSAERIASYVYTKIAQAHPEIPLKAVDIFETETSMARYEP